MLQADEIIQQKNWHELSAAEKAIVHDLAGNEQEYNLLKKMLMVSAEAPEDVPVISAGIRQHVRSTLPVVKKVSINKGWYAVAAGILFLAIAALFILEKEKPAELVKVPDEIKMKAPALITDSSMQQQNNNRVIVKKEKISSPLKNKSIVQKPVFPSLRDTTSGDALYAGVDISIGNHQALLDFVEEAE